MLDSGQPTSLTYPDGEALSFGYDAGSDWLTSVVTTPAAGGGGSTPINLATALSYSGTAGAAGLVTSATIGNGLYHTAASYDADLRLASATTTLASSGAVLFGSSRTYDVLGNVTSTTTSLPAASGQGTDTQAFCYDDLSRLVWAGTSGTPPCTAAATPSTSVASASYQQSFGYDTLDRLTSGPLGSYSFGGGDANHLHAATSIGSSYAARYDAAATPSAERRRARACVPQGDCRRALDMLCLAPRTSGADACPRRVREAGRRELGTTPRHPTGR